MEPAVHHRVMDPTSRLLPAPSRRPSRTILPTFILLASTLCVALAYGSYSGLLGALPAGVRVGARGSSVAMKGINARLPAGPGVDFRRLSAKQEGSALGQTRNLMRVASEAADSIAEQASKGVWRERCV